MSFFKQTTEFLNGCQLEDLLLLSLYVTHLDQSHALANFLQQKHAKSRAKSASSSQQLLLHQSSDDQKAEVLGKSLNPEKNENRIKKVHFQAADKHFTYVDVFRVK